MIEYFLLWLHYQLQKLPLLPKKLSSIMVTPVIYDDADPITVNDKAKLRNWLNERLVVKKVELFKKQ